MAAPPALRDAPPFRLLLDGAADGPWNMAVDGALLESARGGVCTLRLYRWAGPWLSLGRGQDPDPGLVARCTAAGVGVVRRPTGGLAVLHGADLTYALAAPEAVLPPGLQGSYALVARALTRAFETLDVPTRRSPGAARPRRPRGFDCFAEPAEDELLARDRKLCGSAQRRSGGSVLQHGSIRLRPDPPRAAAAAGLDPGRSTSLAELGGNPDPERVADALVAAFAEVLGAPLVAGGLDLAELEDARRESARRAGTGPARPGRSGPAPS
jgi:lipoate-protein ligase A